MHACPLQATDAASPLVISRAAELTLDYPSIVLPDACAKLASPVPSQRANAIAFLAAVASKSGAALSRLLGRAQVRDLPPSTPLHAPFHALL